MKTNLWGEYNVLNRVEAEQIHRASLEILSETGIRLPNERMLKLSASVGAHVNFADQTVRFPDRVVEAALESERKLAKGQPLKEPGRHVRGSIGGLASRIIDMDTHLVRPATYCDLQQSVKISNVLECVDSPGYLIACSDVPQDISQIYQYLGTAMVSLKPFAPRIFSPATVRPLIEMAVVVEGSLEAVKKRGLGGVTAYCISPLQYAEDAIEKALMVHDLGFPVCFGSPMVVAGASGPVTLAGTVTLFNAESLAGIILSHALGHSGGYGSGGIVMDFRTGAGLYADPRKMVLAIAARDMTRFYGFPTSGFHIGMDAMQPGIQASVERIFGSMLSLFLWDACPAVRIGILGPGGAVCSLPQMFVDAEIVNMLNALMDGIEVTPETMAVNLIKSVGIGGSFMDTDHTAEHFRCEMWLPTLFERTFPSETGTPVKERVLEKAREKVRATLAAEYHCPLTKHQVQELERILRSAGGVVPLRCD